ncbi:hypothetical protein HanXRQr2_Chr02g0069341 [Helianthus annuus]|uniref:Uncharacterized protein n=1 Tax=Helianthus annuus TaxID=4232 RepID=A0A9K3NZV5_HELAN|nr:hypothetical protein HanXRQr2_Chr02g0069341 [Helianthus annuus]KAJ0604962.1 hypothetical protein HanHA300_Chr02g0057631 [Helianthus annuus]KAJ0615642.1 hypothetical protein HanIR_Chr02g0081521 [Helianthus annuus]KAJ0618977.1 hypothetical protein HanHA89_Chr02g0066131 [Helianthus annuus]KAJ0777432.1 hypothetical protein HanLR1_Chr02g0060411 [Helianthus annuus]
MDARRGVKMFSKVSVPIPQEEEIRSGSGSDEGVPVVISQPDSAVSKAYCDVAQPWCSL